MPAGVRREPGVKKIRHYRNADGKLLVDITRSLRASERSKAAAFGQFARRAVRSACRDYPDLWFSFMVAD